MMKDINVELKFNTDEFECLKSTIKDSFIKGANGGVLMTKEKYYLDIIAKQQATIDRLREERKALLEAIEEYKYGKENKEIEE